MSSVKIVSEVDEWGRTPEQRQQEVMDDYNKKQAEMAAAKKARQQAALPWWQRDVYADYVPDSVSDTLDSLSGYSKLKPVSDYTNPESEVVNVGDYALDNLGSATADSFGYVAVEADKAARQVDGRYNTARTTIDNAIDGNTTALQDQFFSKAEDKAESKLKDAGKKVLYNLIPGSKKVDGLYQSGKKVSDAGKEVNDAYNDVKEGE